jgi:hypothetical protein
MIIISREPWQLMSILKNFILNYYCLIRLLIKKILNLKHSFYKGAFIYLINITYLINNL